MTLPSQIYAAPSYNKTPSTRTKVILKEILIYLFSSILFNALQGCLKIWPTYKFQKEISNLGNHEIKYKLGDLKSTLDDNSSTKQYEEGFKYCTKCLKAAKKGPIIDTILFKIVKPYLDVFNEYLKLLIKEGASESKINKYLKTDLIEEMLLFYNELIELKYQCPELISGLQIMEINQKLFKLWESAKTQQEDKKLITQCLGKTLQADINAIKKEPGFFKTIFAILSKELARNLSIKTIGFFEESRTALEKHKEEDSKADILGATNEKNPYDFTDWS